MLKASTGSSGSTAFGEPMRAPDCASNWRGSSGLPLSPRINGNARPAGLLKPTVLLVLLMTFSPASTRNLARAKRLKSHHLLCHWKAYHANNGVRQDCGTPSGFGLGDALKTCDPDPWLISSSAWPALLSWAWLLSWPSCLSTRSRLLPYPCRRYFPANGCRPRCIVHRLPSPRSLAFSRREK
jgi:hypothetical protein